jgi:hypothetical protein
MKLFSLSGTRNETEDNFIIFILGAQNLKMAPAHFSFHEYH